MTFSLLPPLAVLAALGAGAYSLHVGLLILAFFGPFFTLLHEMSPGSALYFVWPFVLCGVMVASVVCREAVRWAREHSQRAWGSYLAAAGLLAVAGALAAGWASGLFASLLFDVGLEGFRRFLSNRSLIAVSLPALGILLVFFWCYFRAMKSREGRIRLLDVIVAALLLYGVFQAGYTAIRSGYLFSGLHGFRYYFFMLIAYFLARYSIRTDAEARRILLAFGLATLAGAAQMLVESYLINVAKVPHGQLPWVGHLTKNWEYVPDCGRSFFTGCRPFGLMYMTHNSGLFMLLGVALWLPRFMSAKRWKEVWGYLALVLFLLLSVFWTAKTVFLLFVVSFVVSAVLVRPSWGRALSSAVGIAIFFLLASYYLIPGFRYDMIGELKIIPSRILPAVLYSIRVDLGQMTGRAPVEPEAIQDPRLTGWRKKDDKFPEVRVKRSEGVVRLLDEGGMDGGRVVELVPPRDGMMRFWFPYPSPNLLRGQKIVVGAWVKAPSSDFMRLAVSDTGLSEASVSYSGLEKWEFLTLHHVVGKMSDSLDIYVVVRDVGKDGVKGLLDSLYLVADGKVHDLMSKPQGFPWEKFPDLQRTKEEKFPDLQRTKEDVVGLEKVLSSRRPSLYRFYHYLFGRGATFGEWSTLFFPEGRQAADSFQVVSYSDVEFLAYFEQFGAVGLGLLLLAGILPFTRGWRLSWRESDPAERGRLVGLTLVVFLGLAAMIHLSSMSRVGITSIVYMAMAVLMLKRGKRVDA